MIKDGSRETNFQKRSYNGANKKFNKGYIF